MKIPDEFIGCRVVATNKGRTDYGMVLGRIASWYRSSNTSDVYLLLIENDGSFLRVKVDYVKIIKEDWMPIKTSFTPEKSDRFKILDL